MTATSGHVFVSHSSDNRELAQELAAFIEARGVKVWIAPRDVRPGTDYSEQLQLAIETCLAFVVLVTDMANKSPYVRAETEMAFSSHKPIFPVRISDIQPAAGLAFFLKIRHWTDAFGTGRSESLARLARELQTLSGSGGGGPATDSAAPPASPPLPAPAARPPDPAPVAAAATATSPPLAPESPEEEERWRAAIGPNADYYLERWRRMEAKGSAVSWNWPACLVNLFWLAYRKLWLPMAGLAAAVVVLGVLGSASPALGMATALVSIGLSFVTGAFGNALYRKQVARLAAETAGMEQPAALDQLRIRGGVSVPAMVIALALAVLLTLLLVLAAALSMQGKRAPAAGNEADGAIVPYDAGVGGDPSQGISGQTGDGGVSGEIGGEAPVGAVEEGGAPAEGDKPTE